MPKNILFPLTLLLTISLTLLPPQGPVIGIYTLRRKSQNYTYLATSYAKYLEMSGAQVVPLIHTQTQEELKTILEQINGVLFTGGAMVIDIGNQWTQNAKFILEFAKKQNDQGKVFPIWATCLGHQLMSYLTCGFDRKAITPVSQQASIVNNLTILYPYSYIFKNFKQKHIEAITTDNGVFYFSHHFAVHTSYFQQSKELNEFWYLLATSISPKGEEFVSFQQARSYPFYTSQFHPEKNPFEWHLQTSRTKESIEIVQLLSNNFVEKARMSKNTWRNQSELYKALIYNYEITYLEKDQSFQQVYKFKE